MISKLEEKDYESIYGTSFHGTTVETSAKKLKEALGFEPLGPSGDGKTSREWRVETEYGSFTIYDWKYGKKKNSSNQYIEEWGDFTDDESIPWHIGGISRDKEEQFKEELVKLLGAV
jgi:hypothetical protein